MPTEAKGIATAWLASFTSAITSTDIDAVVSTVLPDGWLRDILTFTWGIRTLHGSAKIKDYLSDPLLKVQMSDIKLVEAPYLNPVVVPLFGGPKECVEAAFTFEIPIGHGSGHVRLLEDESGQWKAFTLYTGLDDLRGYEEATGPEPSVDTQEPWLSWQEIQERRKSEIECDPYVVVVGAGQTGLMIAARFKRMNIPTVVVEKNIRIGDHWRKRYPTLALHTIREHHTFLYQPFPSTWPTYTPRDKLADWMEHYAQSQELVVWTNSEVLPQPTYDPIAKRWEVVVNRSGTNTTLRPAHIVVAIGTLGPPRMPHITDQETFLGEILHANAFAGGDLYKGKRVVVVGAGNSSMDVCEDLAHRGAESVTMVQRSSSCVVSRDKVCTRLSGFWQQNVPADVGDLKFGSLSLGVVRDHAQNHQQEMWDDEKELHAKLRKGGVQLDMGPGGAGQFAAVFERAGGYWLDKNNASDLIASGQIKVKSGVELDRFTQSSIIFTDGSELPADVVIFATGYEMIRDASKSIFGADVIDQTGEIHGLDEEGELKGSYKPSGYPGLWFATSDFAIVRFMSKPLALQIKALQLKLAPERVVEN